MFSGIVEETGIVKSITKQENLYNLSIKSEKVFRGTNIGDSISVDGICLTVTKKNGSVLTFDVMKETLNVTTLGKFKAGRPVNLERALKVNSRIGGHFVSGHIDGTGVFQKKIILPNYVEWQIEISKGLLRYMAPKGSVSIDGVSLTIGKVTRQYFSVYLIPHTLDVTTFGRKRTGELLNIETDLIAKYILHEKQTM